MKKINLRNRIVVKIVSLLLAIIFWSYVMNTENPIITTEVRAIPVRLDNLGNLENQQLVILEPLEPKVNIVISGKRNTISNLDRSRIVASVDMADIDKKNHSAKIDISIPEGLQLIEMSSESLDFKLDDLRSISMKITEEIIGDLPNKATSYRGVKLNPTAITVTGAASDIKRLKSVKTIVDLSTVMEDEELNNPIECYDEQNQKIDSLHKSINSTNIQVMLNYSKTIPIKLDTKSSLSEGLVLKNIELKSTEVEVMGLKEDIKDLKSLTTTPIDLSKIKESGEIETELVLPVGIQLKDPDEKIYAVIEVEKFEKNGEEEEI